jgi:hypothetical protein
MLPIILDGFEQIFTRAKPTDSDPWVSHATRTAIINSDRNYGFDGIASRRRWRQRIPARMVKNASALRQIPINPMRIHVATANDTPNPVNSAIYAATHNGHFGTRASMAVGTIHLPEPATRRAVGCSLDVVDVALQHVCLCMASRLVFKPRRFPLVPDFGATGIPGKAGG